MKQIRKAGRYLRSHDFVRLVVEILFLAGMAAICCYGNRTASFEEMVKVTKYGIPTQ